MWPCWRCVTKGKLWQRLWHSESLIYSGSRCKLLAIAPAPCLRAWCHAPCMMVMDCIPLELGAPVNISFCKFHWSCFILFLFFCTFVSLLVFFSPMENQDKIVEKCICLLVNIHSSNNQWGWPSFQRYILEVCVYLLIAHLPFSSFKVLNKILRFHCLLLPSIFSAYDTRRIKAYTLSETGVHKSIRESSNYGRAVSVDQ